jgi:hypothetical protein
VSYGGTVLNGVAPRNEKIVLTELDLDHEHRWCEEEEEAKRQ